MNKPPLTPDGKPLRVMFLNTSMPVGGAETLQVNLLRGLDRQRFAPEVVCLKEPGPLGEMLSTELPVHSGLIRSRWDVGAWPRLHRLFRRRQADAVITVGAGDKMFWGRLAARTARTPVILSALHSTGWPDGVGRLNRLLTGITDGFIAVAEPHGEHLVEHERFPGSKVFVIPNGVDTDHFAAGARDPELLAEWNIPGDAPLYGIVAALRPEKNHRQLLEAADLIRRREPAARLIIVGDGPERAGLECFARERGLDKVVRFVGNRSDIARVLQQLDVFVLTSKNEANPVSILEALACQRPVVAPDVGSIHQTVLDGRTGFLTLPGNAEQTAHWILRLLQDRPLAEKLGAQGRALVETRFSLRAMVQGYEQLLWETYARKRGLLTVETFEAQVTRLRRGAKPAARTEPIASDREAFCAGPPATETAAPLPCPAGAATSGGGASAAAFNWSDAAAAAHNTESS